MYTDDYYFEHYFEIQAKRDVVRFKKGEEGEERVKEVLGKNINGVKYIINDLSFKVNEKDVQIDHVVITKSGIYVIETKNWSGELITLGDNWKQIIGSEKYIRYSPVKQNEVHIKRLKEKLSMTSPLKNIVCLSGNFKIDMSINDCVYSLSDLQREINKEGKVLNQFEMLSIYNSLLELKYL